MFPWNPNVCVWGDYFCPNLRSLTLGSAKTSIQKSHLDL